MRRRDILFAIGIVLFVLACFFMRELVYHGEAAYVEFSQDGRVILRVRLSGKEEQDIRIDSADGGYNLVHIEGDGVFVREADCENGDCIRQGEIHRTGESIICLPHKLVITIVGDTNGDDEEANQYDTIVRLR